MSKLNMRSLFLDQALMFPIVRGQFSFMQSFWVQVGALLSKEIQVVENDLMVTNPK